MNNEVCRDDKTQVYQIVSQITDVPVVLPRPALLDQ